MRMQEPVTVAKLEDFFPSGRNPLIVYGNVMDEMLEW